MLCAVWSPKGGSGTSVVAAALALRLARLTPTVLVDLAGDQPALLDVSVAAPGISDWSAGGANGAIEQLGNEVGSGLTLIARGSPDGALPASGADHLAHACTGKTVVVDAGTCATPMAQRFVRQARSVVVLQPCYLALHRLTRDRDQPVIDLLAVVRSPERALSVRDVEVALGQSATAVVPHHPTIARSVDAGMLAHRVPDLLDRAIRQLAAALVDESKVDPSAP